MGSVTRFAGLYVLIVFAIGFAFGTVRVLFVEPAIGSFWAVMAEAPLMVAASYAACRPLVRKWWPLDGEAGVEIGLLSFLMLQVLESLLAGLIGPETYINNILLYWGDLSVARMVGLVAQVLFAAMPFIQILRISAHERE